MWEARQLSLARLVAIKVYQPELAEGDRRGFPREAAAAGRLSNHPGVVTAYDAGVLPDDRPYLVMELCPGGSLAQWLKPDSRASEERVRQVGVRIAEALTAVHACGVLHRDIKPGNILIDSYGNPQLADFGLAAVAGAEEAAADVLGVTPAYAPPEAFGMHPSTQAGDVYSLAATLYALLAGARFRTVDATTVTLEQMIDMANRPASPIPGVNWYLMGVLLGALSSDPAARPSAARFRDQLADAPSPRTPRRRSIVGAAERRVPVPARRHLGAPRPTAAVQNRGTAGVAVASRSQPAPDGLVSAEAPAGPGKRRLGAVAVSAVLALAIASGTAWLLNEPASSDVPAAMPQQAAPQVLPSNTAPTRSPDVVPPTSTAPDTGDSSRSGAAEYRVIEMHSPAVAAKPFETVRLSGTYRGGEDSLLQVQRWEGGKWLAFPIPMKTDAKGQFTAYVELGHPRRYRLRILHPDSGVKSKPFELLIKG